MAEKKYLKKILRYCKLSLKKILIVEDDKANVLYLSSILKKKYAVTTVDNGSSVAFLHEKNNFDLILMNIKMPVVNGFEAAQAIRKNDKSVPIFATTGYSASELKVPYFNEHLQKPFLPYDVLSMVKKYIR